MLTTPIKQTIVTTAAGLFYKNGYNRTGINEIIKEAGVAKATLYGYFKSKEELCVSYLQYKEQRFLKNLETYTAKVNSGQDQIVSIFDYLLSFYHSNQFHGCWCLKTISEIPKENESIRLELQRQKSALKTFIKRLILRNLITITEIESKYISNQVYLLYEGAIAESYLQNDDWPIKASKDMCEKLLAMHLKK